MTKSKVQELTQQIDELESVVDQLTLEVEDAHQQGYVEALEAAIPVVCFRCKLAPSNGASRHAYGAICAAQDLWQLLLGARGAATEKLVDDESVDGD